MQDKQMYLASAECAKGTESRPISWDAVYSGQTLRTAWRRLFPPTMLKDLDCSSINSEVGMKGSHVNELEETVASSRSSFADLWDSTSVEIRDGTHPRADFNMTTSLLMTCKSQVIYPYFYILSLVAWRPFHFQSFRYQGCTVRKVLNVIYTLFIFFLIIFGYTSSIIACQARLDIKHESEIQPTASSNWDLLKAASRVTTTSSPKTTMPLNAITISNQSGSSTSSVSGGPGNIRSTHGRHDSHTIPFYTLGTPALIWKPAVIECTHIFSTYVVPNVLHFLAFFTGFYLFRIQESEGLSALIEKVFLLCSFPKKIVSRLRLFLFGVFFMVFLGLGNLILFCYAFSLGSVTGFNANIGAQWAMASLMVISHMVELCVTAVTIVNYCAQCELLIFYLREINLQMEEKTKDLTIIMKDVLEVKKNLTRVNGLISVIATLVVFSYFELAVIGVCNLFVYFKQIHSTSQLMYRVIAPIIDLIFISFPIAIAARLTSVAHQFKQKCLHIRVFGYPSASQLDLDSFVLFCHSAEMKAKLLFMPVQGSYLAGFIALFVFVLLLMLQTNIIAGNNHYL
ncbi:uncharacterized protein [Montipora foliosa]|uniref:uncharacterized protein isoform X1 n=1 Tax=Montipora foliosa TaxID=591990 RepID=UPI0035F12244